MLAAWRRGILPDSSGRPAPVQRRIPLDGRAGGPFEPAHVWFLAYLLMFTLVLLPALWPLRRDADRGAALARRIGSRAGLAIATLAIAAVEGAHAAEDAGGWSRWTYPLFLAFGFLLAADGGIEARLVAIRRHLALAAAGAFLAMAATNRRCTTASATRC